MEDASKLIMTIFGSIVVIAIVSVIVGRNSKAPQAIQDTFGGLSKVVAAAVNPVSQSYGYGNGTSAQTGPSNLSINNLANWLTNGVKL